MSDHPRCTQCEAELAADAPQGLCPACLLKRGLETQTLPSGGSGAAAPAFVPPTPEALASQFPDLEILEFIGRGGMGMVYKARQKRLDRLVALKILLPHVACQETFPERFAREARAMAMLSHANIVAVHDFGQAGGQYYFLMEFVDGLTLRQLLDSGKLTPQAALAVVPQICDALQYAHDSGVVHRDIKPENILLDKNRGRVKIADFGLAKLVGRPPDAFSLTGSGQVMGTPHYMAPEQMEHPQEVDHRADIYSLGVVFYQMLTGELPLGRFAPPSRKVAIDVRLDEVVLRAMEHEPELRYQQASEVKTEIESIACSSPSLAPPAIEAARQQVRGPAIGLIVTSLINWLAIFVLALVMYPVAMREGLPPDIFLLAAVILAAGSAMILKGALRMQRLESLTSARVASVLAMLIGPGYLVGWPVGIWSLVVLGRPEVRGAFAAKPNLSLRMRIALALLVVAAALSIARLFQLRPWAGPMCVQNTTDDIQPDGSIRFTGMSEQRNDSGADQTTDHFVNSDFVKLEKIADAAGRPVAFVVDHQGSTFHYSLFLNDPVPPGQYVVLKTEGTKTGLIQPAGEPGTFMYHMRHWPSVSGITRCSEVHRLPPGAELLKKSPDDMLESRTDGRIELSIERMIAPGGSIEVSYLYRAAPAAQPKGKPASKMEPGGGASVVQSFSTSDATIAKDLTVENGAWSLTAKGPNVYRLFEVPLHDVDDAIITYRAQLKSQQLEGRAYLEMWCRLPGQGESFSRGLGNVLSGSNEWATFETPFFLKKGEAPDRVRLNLVVEGTGRIGIKDVELLVTFRDPGRAAQAGRKRVVETTLPADIFTPPSVPDYKPPQPAPAGPEAAEHREKPATPGAPGPPVYRYTINRAVAQFPQEQDLSTPEAACAAWQRASARKDAQAMVALSWLPLDPKQLAQWLRDEERRDPEGLTIYLKALAESTIVEVETCREELCGVVTLLLFPEGQGADPYSLRSFGRIDGQWKNLGEDRLPDLDAARADFARKLGAAWEQFQEIKSRHAASAKPAATYPAPHVPVEFRIVPNPPDTARKPALPKVAATAKESFAEAAVKELSAKGPAARPGGGEFCWVETAPPRADLYNTVTGTYQGKTYVLLCDREPYVMRARTGGPDAWSVEEVSVRTGRQGHPEIGLRLDRRGGELLGALTKANLHNRMAIVVDGKAVSAPTVQSEISRECAITGGFDAHDIEAFIVNTLKAAIPKKPQ